MAVNLFGFTIGRTQKEQEQQERVSFTIPQAEDGSIDVADLQAHIQAAGDEGRGIFDLFTTIVGLT